MVVNIVGVYPLSEEATVPFLGTELSACHDVCACFHTETVKFHGRTEPVKVEKFGTPDAFVRLFPDDMALIPTGLIFCLPRQYFLDIRSRSGNTWKRFLTVANQPGTIDSDYTGEVSVILHNTSEEEKVVQVGDRIAQGSPRRVEKTQFTFVEQLSPTDRDGDGFGSTGA